MRYLLDTNVCVDYLNARFPGVAARLRSQNPEDLAVNSIVVVELRFGASESSRPEFNHRRVDLLLAEVPCLDFDIPAAAVCGDLRAALQREGRPIAPYDLMIAAQALSRDQVLVSDNLDEFRRVPLLRVESWR